MRAPYLRLPLHFEIGKLPVLKDITCHEDCNALMLMFADRKRQLHATPQSRLSYVM